MTTVLRVGLAWCVMWAAVALADDAAKLTIEQPRPRQVVQRVGLAPRAGFADVVIKGRVAKSGLETGPWAARVVPIRKENRKHSAFEWQAIVPKFVEQAFEVSLRVPAGGWYRIELRCGSGESPLATGSVEPIGVGEVFIVAGQSYATNCNDERLNVADADGRVVAFDTAQDLWRVAHDPQPAPDGSDGGSIWPPVGDALVQSLGVPIAFANVAVGGTSSLQWMPTEKLHPRLVKVGQSLGAFRAVLWQQGESDVIAKTSTEQYVANVKAIRAAAAKTWSVDPVWLLAKSTHHPTVYDDSLGVDRIRAGIDELTKLPGFQPGPDTDTLRGENRGGPQTRRHFSGLGQRRAAEMWVASIRREIIEPTLNTLRVGIAEGDITPPVGFPMAGYYHERLAEGALDPLKAKAIVFRDGQEQAALVVCDLIGIATDLSREVRRRASEQTGIPASNIVLAGTHTHTAPDYMKELFLFLGRENQDPARRAYIEKLISVPVATIVKAHESAQPAVIESGAATQQTPVSFNRRFVMRDGSVRTWQSFENRDVVRQAGPIDPEIGLVTIKNADGKTRGVLSNFALHLDTVGGQKWSADYPHFIDQTLKQALGSDVVSIFGTGCCGDINHSNPRRRERNKADFIGGSIGQSIERQVGQLTPLERPRLVVNSRVVPVPLQDATKDEVTQSLKVLAAAQRKEKVEFFEHVTAYKKLILDQLRHKEPHAATAEHITWGLSRSLAGIGDKLPLDVTVMTLGDDVAIVCLPGEVFVELGMAIKQASPFRTTLVIELSNHVESIYIPHRAAYAGGSYEVTNSAVEPGSGEMLVEAAIGLLREATTANRAK